MARKQSFTVSDAIRVSRFSRRFGWWVSALVLVCALIFVAYNQGYFDTWLKPNTPAVGTDFSKEDWQSAYDDLDTLVVSEKGNLRYDRETQFGGWEYDFDNSGCSTRQDLLLASLENQEGIGCKVKTGVLPYDPYTGKINVPWSSKKPATLQVDHVVALQDVSESGALLWGTPEGKELEKTADPSVLQVDAAERRKQIANDPLNLILVDGPQNQSKGGKDASEWVVPDNPEYRCDYITRQEMVKSKYGLSVSPAEKKVMKDTLSDCIARAK